MTSVTSNQPATVEESQERLVTQTKELVDHMATVLQVVQDVATKLPVVQRQRTIQSLHEIVKLGETGVNSLHDQLKNYTQTLTECQSLQETLSKALEQRSGHLESLDHLYKKKGWKYTKRSLEVDDLRKQSENLINQMASMDARLKDSKDELAAIKTQLRDIKAEYATLQAAINAAKEKQVEEQQEVDNLAQHVQSPDPEQRNQQDRQISTRQQAYR